MTNDDIIDKINDKFDEIEDKVYNINKEFSTKEEIEKMKEEENLLSIDELYEAIYKDNRKCNELYKTVKYKLYSDSIKEVYNQLKEDRIPLDRRDFELVRAAARKTVLILLSEVYKTTNDPIIHEHFSKLASLIATD